MYKNFLCFTFHTCYNENSGRKLSSWKIDFSLSTFHRFNMKKIFLSWIGAFDFFSKNKWTYLLGCLVSTDENALVTDSVKIKIRFLVMHCGISKWIIWNFGSVFFCKRNKRMRKNAVTWNWNWTCECNQLIILWKVQIKFRRLTITAGKETK